MKKKRTFHRVAANLKAELKEQVDVRIKELNTNVSAYLQDLIKIDLTENNTHNLLSKIDMLERTVEAQKSYIRDNYYDISFLEKVKRIFADPKIDLEKFENVKLLEEKKQALKD